MLDHYRVEDLVATGGMASIFRATDTKTGLLVAVKIPHSAKLSDWSFRERFRRETQIGETFNHPGIVKMLFGGGAGGRYAVMEWIDGQLLRVVLDEKKKLPIERAVRITLAICDPLQYIHSHGLVHGDLKPDNVMVDAGDNVKLIDFGLARGKRINLWNLARPKEAMGTPDYVSPEQIKGKFGDIRSDVYSLGIMLFEMLTGDVPFSGLDPVAAMNLRLLVDPPSPREINPEISPRLEAVVHRALARDRAKRYSSAREIGSDLSEALLEEREAQPLESFANV